MENPIKMDDLGYPHFRKPEDKLTSILCILLIRSARSLGTAISQDAKLGHVICFATKNICKNPHFHWSTSPNSLIL